MEVREDMEINVPVREVPQLHRLIFQKMRSP